MTCSRPLPPFVLGVATSPGNRLLSTTMVPALRRCRTLVRASLSLQSPRYPRPPRSASVSMPVPQVRAFSTSLWMRIALFPPYLTLRVRKPRKISLPVAALLRQPRLPWAARGTFGLVPSSRTLLAPTSCRFQPSRLRLPCNKRPFYPRLVLNFVLR